MLSVTIPTMAGGGGRHGHVTQYCFKNNIRLPRGVLFVGGGGWAVLVEYSLEHTHAYVDSLNYDGDCLCLHTALSRMGVLVREDL